VLRTVECEAVVFDCALVVPPSAPGQQPTPAPGIEHLLARLPGERSALVGEAPADGQRQACREAELVAPDVVVSSAGAPAGPAPLTDAAAQLGVDPAACLAVADTPAGVTAAIAAGMKVIAVAGAGDATALAGADLVVPTLHSLRPVGVHPLLVLEVDALPDLGTFRSDRTRRP
jgi:beta-phosphoglucomutase-like phosphatase (HAD superfamily)